MTFWKDKKGVYLIERINIDVNDNEPIYYVGQSVGIFSRWNQHCNGNEQNVDIEINRFGYTNFTFKILEEVSKTKDLNERETYWINEFKKKGESKMFNISQTANANKNRQDPSIKKEIKSLFEEEIGRSIYAIAEKYKINFMEVVKIRKPLLTKQGLKYDSKTKNIIDGEGQLPKNWKGDKIPKDLGEKILKLKKQDIDTKDIAYECNVSMVDLKTFLASDEENQSYEFATKLK